MSRYYGSDHLGDLCAACEGRRQRRAVEDKQRLRQRLVGQEETRRAVVATLVERLVAAGAPGAVPHFHTMPRRYLPDRRVPQGISGFPIGRLSYQERHPDPRAEGAMVWQSVEALVLTDARVVRVGGGTIVGFDWGAVRDALAEYARRHAVALSP